MSIELYGVDTCYNGNPKLKKAGVHIQITKAERQEFEKCYNDVNYFIEKYCKIVSLDRGLVNFDLYDFQKEMVDIMSNNRFSIFVTARQMGKALDVNTPIPTPSGFKTMGDIKVGDEVYGRDGKIYNVTFATEFQHNRKCYNIKFDDGSTIVADAEHIWTVDDKSFKRGKKERDLTTQEMLDNGLFLSDGCKKYSIKNTAPILNEEKNLEIDPYLLGYWLGDGESLGSRITYHAKDDAILEYCTNLGYETTVSSDKRNSNVKTLYIKNFIHKIKNLNLYGNKHIPENYLWSSVEQRTSLLKGLMDSDGNSCKPVRGREFNNICEFSNKNSILVDNFVQLARSLGFKPKKTSKFINGIEYFIVRFTAYNDYSIGAPFSLERKIKNIGPREKYTFTTSRLICSIEEVDSRPVKCIQVSAPDHIFLAGEQFIPTHNTTTVAGYLLHAAIFNKNFNIAILANKGDQAQEILERMQGMFEELPWFLQPGVKVWNKRSITLGNGTRVFTAATSGSAIRGKSMNIVYLDEFAFVDNDLEFYTSTYPVVTAGKTTKVIITSTPKGMNLFYKLWSDAVAGKNTYTPLTVTWDKHPERDESWKQEQLANMNEKQFAQEFECQFHGSSDTLINGPKLQQLAAKNPLPGSSNDFKIYSNPVKDHIYVTTVDVSEGVGKDYSIVNVIDVTITPYEQVAIFRNNKTTPLQLGYITEKISKKYNNAFIVVESNSIGSTVCNVLFYDLDYENLIRTKIDKSENKTSGGARSELGLRMTKKSKSFGCSSLKDLIENEILIVNDKDTINELTTFVKDGSTWKAEKGKNDDTVMTLVSFAWFADQNFFSEETDINTRGAIANKMFEDEMVPALMFFDDGIDENEEYRPYY